MVKRETIQTEAHAESLKHQRCGLEISMRVGKTKIGLMNLESHWFPSIRPLVAAPNKPIFQSWKDDIVKFGYEGIAKDIKYTTYRSIHKLDPKDYDIVYLDEFQALLPVHEEFLSRFRGKIVGLSGTAPEEYSQKAKLVAKYCPIVYRYTVNEAIDDNILNNYRVFIHLLDLDKRKNFKQTSKNGGSWWSSEQEVYEYWCDKIDDASTPEARGKASIMLMKKMEEFPSKIDYGKTLLEYIKHKVIFFASTKEQADKVCKYSYHSGNPDSVQNLELFSNDIISKMSCVMQLNAGVTIPGLKACVVQHSYGNNNKLAQRISRCLGLDASETADLHILGYQNTIDITWILRALENFDMSKVQYIDSKRLLNKVAA